MLPKGARSDDTHVKSVRGASLRKSIDVADIEDDGGSLACMLASQRIVYRDENRQSTESFSTITSGVTKGSDMTPPAKVKRRARTSDELQKIAEKSGFTDSPETLLDAWVSAKRTRPSMQDADKPTRSSARVLPPRAAAVGRKKTLRVDSSAQRTLVYMHDLHAQQVEQTKGLRQSHQKGSTEGTEIADGVSPNSEDKRKISTQPKKSIAPIGLGNDTKVELQSNLPTSMCASPSSAVERDEYDDLFNEDFFKIVEEAENRMLSTLSTTLKGPLAARTDRLQVEQSVRSETSHSLRAVVCNDPGVKLEIELRDQWLDLVVNVGDIVRVIFCSPRQFIARNSQKIANSCIIVDAESNLLIVHPDILINGTTIASSFSCTRKSILQDTVTSYGSAGSLSSLCGTLAHDLLQDTLITIDRAKSVASDLELTLRGKVVDLIKTNPDSLYAVNATEKEVETFLLSTIPGIVQWSQAYLAGGKKMTPVTGASNQVVSIMEVKDIEESVWSPTFGLKGKIDASLQMSVNGEDAQMAAFEFKTGRVAYGLNNYHRAQVLLYSLLMSDRYDAFISRGLLTYISGNNVSAGKENLSQGGEYSSVVVATRAELVGLVMSRNDLASYISFRETTSSTDVTASALGDYSLPPLIRGRRGLCENCFMVDSCMIQHFLIEGGGSRKEDLSDDVIKGPGAELYLKKTEHLTEEHADFYSTWCKSLRREEMHAAKCRSELWTLPAEERERRGLTWASMQLACEASRCAGRSGVAHLHTFSRREADRHRQCTGLRIEVGDYVVISAEIRLREEKDNVEHTNGYVTKTAVSTGFVREVSVDFVRVECHVDLGAWGNSRGYTWRGCKEDLLWRIDKEELTSGLKLARANLEALFLPFSDAHDQSPKLRKLVVELKVPSFDRSRLNNEQTGAIIRAASARDYVLFLGMPGTGKTSTIASLIVSSVHAGETVLLCGHTHACVDNVLLRLREKGMTNFLRLGHRLQVHRDLQDKLLKGASGMDEYKKMLEEPPVVGVTCLGINHAMFTRRRFDMVIVDEAGQVSQLACLGPLRFATKRFVLVGDHHQLPPLRKSSAREEWRDAAAPQREEESLFKRLSDAHPEAVEKLVKQYRMAEDIMSLSNELVYENAMQCGSSSVAKQTLDIPSLVQPCRISKKSMKIFGVGERSAWLQRILNPETRVLFIDTDAIPGYEESVGKGRLRTEKNPKASWTALCERTSKCSTLDERAFLGLLVTYARVRGLVGLSFANRQGEDDSELRGQRSNKTVNSTEAGLVMGMCATLILRGVAAKDIGVISPYRSQVGLLQRTAKTALEGIAADVDIRTIDQFQGCDRECIIISFVRSNPNNWVNVALSRAKSKLLLVGSRSTLYGGSKFLANMIDLIAARGWETTATFVSAFAIATTAGPFQRPQHATADLPLVDKHSMLRDVMLENETLPPG